MKAEVIRDNIAEALCNSQGREWGKVPEHGRAWWRTQADAALLAIEQAGLAVVKTEELEAALKPFAEFADNTDENGWTSRIHHEPISTWFGPSDFRRAAALLAAITEEGRG